MPELKKEHVLGAVGSAGLIGVLLQQIFAQDARNTKRWEDHAKDDIALHERVASIETRLNQRLGVPVPDEADEIEAAKAEARKEVKP